MAPITKRRIIINSDAKNECDDQWAIAWALMCPNLDIRGIVPAHFGTWKTATSMEDSRDEVDKILELMDLTGKVRVANGAPRPIRDEKTAADSPGARLIVEESKLATRDDPLYVAFLGTLTDMASAILLDPDIVKRPVIVVWIGGEGYRDLDAHSRLEFNLSMDIPAANVVFDSGIKIWQLPTSIYYRLSFGFLEMEERIGGTSDLADYLIKITYEWGEQACPSYHSKGLGDCAAIGLILNPTGANAITTPSPRFGIEGHRIPGKGHPVRVIEWLDTRFILEDMFRKIARFGREQNQRKGAHA